MKFSFSGELIRESTKTGNRRTAEQIEAARKTQLAKGEVGIKDRPPVPTLANFVEKTFLIWVESQKRDKLRTVEFYRMRVSRLKEEKPLPSREAAKHQKKHKPRS